MKDDLSRIVAALFVLGALLASGTSSAIEIESLLHSSNRLRECSTIIAGSCLGSEPEIDFSRAQEFASPGQPLSTGSIATQTADPNNLSAQSATSIGFQGPSFTPTISAYAYSGAESRYSVGASGFQRYVLTAAGDVTLTATLTFSQTGQTGPDISENPRGRVRPTLFAFHVPDGVLDTDDAVQAGEDCVPPLVFDATTGAGVIIDCILLGGFPEGTLQQVDFGALGVPVSDGIVTDSLTISGEVGDVFYVGAFLSIVAHRGGFGDSRTTLQTEFDSPSSVQASFTQETFVPAPPPSSVCEIELSQTSYIDGETITASVFQLVNPGVDPATVDLKNWLVIPSISPISVIDLDDLILPAGFDADLGPIPLLPVDPSLPRGTWAYNCRLLDPVTGAERSFDLNTFGVQ